MAFTGEQLHQKNDQKYQSLLPKWSSPSYKLYIPKLTNSLRWKCDWVNKLKTCCFSWMAYEEDFPTVLWGTSELTTRCTKLTNWYPTDDRRHSSNAPPPFSGDAVVRPSLPLPLFIRLCRSEWTVLWREACCTRRWSWWRTAAPSSGTWPSPWTGTLSTSCLTIRWGHAPIVLRLSGETPSGWVMSWAVRSSFRWKPVGSSPGDRERPLCWHARPSVRYWMCGRKSGVKSYGMRTDTRRLGRSATGWMETFPSIK